MNEAIMSLPKPDAELQVAEVKELDQKWHLLSYEAKGGVMDVLDHLTYCSYRHNRRLSPEITLEEWGRIFPDVERLEARYQVEISAEERNKDGYTTQAR